jgi:hypothetical protein
MKLDENIASSLAVRLGPFGKLASGSIARFKCIFRAISVGFRAMIDQKSSLLFKHEVHPFDARQNDARFSSTSGH